jgi:anthranilate/para-aminobenzoate synthase component I
VADSVPEREYLETLSKAEAMVQAVTQAVAHSRAQATQAGAGS